MSFTLIKADARRLPLADHSVDLVIGSPPYVDARLYLEDGIDLGIARKCNAWIEWMLDVTAEALRVSRGLVLWVVAGKTEDWNYQPAPEGLLYRWWARGGECHCFRPCYWHRVGIPGSGGEQWYRADVEYVLAFKRPGRLPYGEPTANGHPPKWAPGGEMSHRLTDGQRRNQWGGHVNKTIDARKKDGSYSVASKPSHVVPERDGYSLPSLANPGVLIHTSAGGNQLGSTLAHDNEAPYPVDVPSFFINSHAPPGGLVCDPFSGSATTGDAAMRFGRNYIGCDLRMSQCRLGRKRLRGVTPGFVFPEGDSP